MEDAAAASGAAGSRAGPRAPAGLFTPARAWPPGRDPQTVACPYGSPVSGLCSDATGPQQRAPPGAAAAWQLVGPSPRSSLSWAPREAGSMPSSSFTSGSGGGHPGPPAARGSPWQPGLPPSAPHQHGQQQQQHPAVAAADSRQCRDQRAGASGGSAGAKLGPGQAATATPPLELLLAPLLPSADEAKLSERLSQLREALDEQRRLAAAWEQQAIVLQQALADGQQEALSLRGQLVGAQQNIQLLGGNLQGRLSLVQGSVLAQLRAQLAGKDSAIAASELQVGSIRAELDRLSCGFVAKLGAEQAERERLGAEAAQARLLCMARGRQLDELQAEVQRLRNDTAGAAEGAAAAASLQQEQLESLHQRLAEAQQELGAARQSAAEASAQLAAAEGGRAGLRQQVEELQAGLADKQLQVEWLEGKVADLEESDAHQHAKRHAAEVARVQAAAAARQSALEQQLAEAQQELAAWQRQAEAAQQQLEQLGGENAALQQQLADEREAAAAQLAGAQLQPLRRGALSAEEQDDDAASAAGDADGKAGGSASDADDAGSGTDAATAREHALRAQLGIANAEVARLRHELDVATAARDQERQLTGQEIMRLQQELSHATASASNSGASGSDPPPGAEAASHRQERRRQQQQQLRGSATSWQSVHNNPIALIEDEGGGGRDDAEQHGQQHQLAPADAAPATGSRTGPEELAAYNDRLQDQAATIASLQAQLKQQQLLLAALQQQKRTGSQQQQQQLRGVHDSAASRSSLADILGLDGAGPARRGRARPEEQGSAAQASAGGGRCCSDAAVQTDGQPTESAGSTAAAPAPGHAGGGSDDANVVSSPQRALPPAQGGDGGSSALLAAARQEIQHLQELNQQLLHTHAQELKASVSFDAARQAVREAKARAKAKAAALLQASNASWGEKLVAAEEERGQLERQLEELRQQRDDQAAECARQRAATAELQAQLSAAKRRCEQLQAQLAALSDSHAQELEQVRMEAEADVAATLLEAGAAAARSSWQEASQQQQQQRECCEQGVQASDPGPQRSDVGLQTDPGQQPQECAGEEDEGQQQPERAAPGPPSTPRGSAALRGEEAGAAAAALRPSARSTTPVGLPAQAWGGAGDDDDLCRMSSASDTPASTSSRAGGSRQLPLVAGDSAAGPAPSAASVAGLPELVASSSPMAPGAGPPLDCRQQQQEEEKQGAVAEPPPAAQLSSWHEELVRQQAQLNQLGLRLSQQRSASPLQQQRQQRQQQRWQQAPGAGQPLVGGSVLAAPMAGQELPGSPLLRPGAGGRSPVVLQQRRQQHLRGVQAGGPAAAERAQPRYLSSSPAPVSPAPAAPAAAGASTSGLGLGLSPAAPAPRGPAAATGAAASAASAAGGGLVQACDDVMGALSLSSYHRDRSRQQEARARQHALNAQDALDRAAAVRSSRLTGAARRP